MKFFILTTLAVGILTVLQGQTSIPGGAVSGTWAVAGSPYNIQGSILIPNDSSLVIQPGVSVNFMGPYKLLVKGQLLAIGTQANGITFSASDTVVGWRSIRFDKITSNNDSSKLCFCSIQYAKAKLPAPDNNGGAIYIKDFSKLVISNSTISNCSADADGGGIYIDNGNPLIMDNIISHNYAGAGGGIFSKGNPVIKNNTIVHNTSSAGGGIFIPTPVWPATNNATISGNTIAFNNASAGSGGGATLNDSVFFKNNLVSNNSAMEGGGLYLNGPNWPLHNLNIEHNTITRNHATQRGGGVFAFANTINIISNNITYNYSDYAGGAIAFNTIGSIPNNFICNNYSLSEGGGIWLQGDVFQKVFVINNVITNNSSQNGGGLWIYYSLSSFVNNTIVNNKGLNGGNLFLMTNSTPKFTNCIIRGGAASLGDQIYLQDEASDPDFYYSNVEGGSAGFYTNSNFFTGIYTNNIDSLPYFTSPTAGADTLYNGFLADWSLQSVSRCIDVGNSSANTLAFDISGNPRISGAQIDIGAYEFQLGGGIPVLNIENYFIIHPNPTSGNLTILCTDPSIKFRVEIVNAIGQIVFESLPSTGKINVVLNTPDGFYVTKIYVKNNTVLKKLVKASPY